ncbi:MULTISPECIES: potassium/proton antiporter [unclassified Streptomyces]|uniref:potassium/proton antiporter n=1 Tax=unclassified Streptomyces TaxID=2593676 RepID=UPI0022B5E969|nr:MULTISPECIES: potassium/proton antiporter [unclassified Streptomyces]MCZ7414772.1 potassium/proton antiporter [Streptomyces sp. WMMC897]MCZ7431696.1 potassium/proton antiporter [Streptomyces sp. WMMC1477]
MTVDRLNELLLACALVLLVAVAAVRLSTRSGLPTLLIYLGIGVAMGQDGLGVQFSDPELMQVLGYAALVMILAEGGLATKWREIRPAVGGAAVLATVGVGVSVLVTAAAAHYLVGLSWQLSLVLGAVVSSTDAAAVFSVLRVIPLPRRLSGMLEAESGFNDAPVVILVVAFSALATDPQPWYALVGTIVLQLAIGIVAGGVVGKLGELGLRHVALPASGLYPIAVLALCVLSYAVGALAHGSGFLATYITGLILGNAKLPHRPAVRGFADGVAWIAQIGLFVLLGLLVTPSDLLDDFWPAVLIGLALTLVARPLSVVLSLTPFRMPWRQQMLMSWAGLRGAVPIVLATIPMVAGLEQSGRIFNIVFVLVVVYTLVQGPTLPWLARRLRIGNGDTAMDVDIESAPLERLRGHLLSLSIPAASRMHGVEVAELRLPPGSAVTLVVRNGRSFVPTPTTVLMRGDDLLVVATDAVRDQAERRLIAVGRGGKLAGWLGRRPHPGPPGASGPPGRSAPSR